jgi:hypothetical protein
MRLLPFIIILICCQVPIACTNKKVVNHDGQSEVKQIVTLSEEEDSPDPPPPGFTTRFKNLQEWLLNVCANDKPQKPIATYNFALFEGSGRYTLCLTGTNTYAVSPGSTAIRIDFTPKDMYFTLPGSEYAHLERDKVLTRLTSQLHEFITTDKFKQSFLGEAKSITTDWKGQIWSK